MKRGERKRGFNAFRKEVRDKPTRAKQVANCKSCKFFDHNEECTNGNVTSFDVVKDDNRTYCTFWKGFEYDNGRKSKDDW